VTLRLLPRQPDMATAVRAILKLRAFEARLALDPERWRIDAASRRLARRRTKGRS
jgi:hypothetical protein